MGTGWDETPDEDEQHGHDGEVEVEDGLPTPVLDDDRAVEGAKDSASFGDHANQAESNAASFYAIEVSRNGHGDGDDGATSSGLYKAGRDQPDKTWRVNIQAEVL